MTLLDRDDLVDGLRDLIAELRSQGETAGLRVVGGAAIVLRHFDRPSTRDVDALHVRMGSDEAVTRAALRVAARRGWDDDWLKFGVTNTGSEPTWGRAAGWESIFDDGTVSIEVASAETLLAMKLRANRPGRDTDDIRQLLAICDVASVEQADDFYTEFYPGEGLSPRAWRMVSSIYAEGLPAKPETPPAPHF